MSRQHVAQFLAGSLVQLHCALPLPNLVCTANQIYSSDEEEIPTSQADTTSQPVGMIFPTNKEPYIEFTDADRQATRQQIFKKCSPVKSTDESTDEYPDSETECSIAVVDLQSLERLYPSASDIVPKESTYNVPVGQETGLLESWHHASNTSQGHPGAKAI
ncbi:hypothetical protein PILCRDRAFT_17043 [Piloderma croceum F 1598]|uniref:Uncharacterized protein n=1 Tax=Piloderma croceum (strain F 1598) TaxID=765440 RepID=A0A0C3ACG6_PILCF|nr:hypothetical protein PILCRDRAFT_17043 [Piloderma croceum F 1598]